MLEIHIGEKLRSRIIEILRSKSLDNESQSKLEQFAEKSFLSVSEMKLLVEENKKAGFSSLKEFLSDSKLNVPYFQKPEEKVSAEVVKRREYLKLRAEERSYNMMMFGKAENPHTEEVITMGNQFNTMKNQYVTSFNMIFTIIASFGMAYYIGQRMGFLEAQAMVLGLVAAILMMVLEMVLFIMRAVQIENTLEAKPSRGKEVEAKVRSGALLTPNDAVTSK